MGLAVRRILIVCALIAGAVLAFSLWKAKVDRDLDAAWRRSLGGASFLECYPKSDDNATVRELEWLGVAIGIHMAPADAPWRSRPTPEAAGRFEDVKGPFNDLFAPGAQAEDGALAAPPPEVADYLDFARPTLRRVVEVLLHDPTPVWQRDLGQGPEAPVRNLLGVLQLQKTLLLEAREQIRSGHPKDALAVLEASWRLNEAFRTHDPSLVTQLIALAVLKLQQPVLRSLSAAAAPSTTFTASGWGTRLDGVAVRSWILLGLHTEAFRDHQISTRDRPLGREGPALPQSIWIRLQLWDSSRRLEAMIQDLPRHDVRRFDPEAFNRPRWPFIARLFLLFNAGEPWGKAVSAELSAELTARILEERERLAAGGPPRAADRRPSRVPGLFWIYEDTPEGTRIYLDGDLACRVVKPVPLRFLVRRPLRMAGRSAD